MAEAPNEPMQSVRYLGRLGTTVMVSGGGAFKRGEAKAVRVGLARMLVSSGHYELVVEDEEKENPPAPSVKKKTKKDERGTD